MKMVIALGGRKNKAQIGDMGIDGRIYPVGVQPHKFPAPSARHLCRTTNQNKFQPRRGGIFRSDGALNLSISFSTNMPALRAFNVVHAHSHPTLSPSRRRIVPPSH